MRSMFMAVALLISSSAMAEPLYTTWDISGTGCVGQGGDAVCQAIQERDPAKCSGQTDRVDMAVCQAIASGNNRACGPSGETQEAPGKCAEWTAWAKANAATMAGWFGAAATDDPAETPAEGPTSAVAPGAAAADAWQTYLNPAKTPNRASGGCNGWDGPDVTDKARKIICTAASGKLADKTAEYAKAECRSIATSLKGAGLLCLALSNNEISKSTACGKISGYPFGAVTGSEAVRVCEEWRRMHGMK